MKKSLASAVDVIIKASTTLGIIEQLVPVLNFVLMSSTQTNNVRHVITIYLEILPNTEKD